MNIAAQRQFTDSKQTKQNNSSGSDEREDNNMK